jgi:hypothetical protein
MPGMTVCYHHADKEALALGYRTYYKKFNALYPAAVDAGCPPSTGRRNCIDDCPRCWDDYLREEMK